MGADRWTRLAGIRKRFPAVIGYHRVVEEFSRSAKSSIPAMLISRRMLERHLDWLGRRYEFVSLGELGSALASGRKFERPVAAITFDDGYRDVYENGFPILKRKGIPAAVFVVAEWIGSTQSLVHDRLYRALSAYFRKTISPDLELPELRRCLGISICRLLAGTQSPFAATRALLLALCQQDLLHLLKALEERISGPNDTDPELQPLSWEMLSEMQRAGITVGSHTSTHPVLTNEPRQAIRAEVSASRQVLELRLGAPILHFAYPDGCFDAATVQAVEAAGYRYAYTTCRHQDPNDPRLTIPRKVLWENSCLNSHGDFSPAVMSCQISGLLDLVAGCPREHSLARKGRDRASAILPVESRP
jgi:peptidoglycan/xylan/chitin deacetylase (PgdA/CDA1 family)